MADSARSSAPKQFEISALGGNGRYAITVFVADANGVGVPNVRVIIVNDRDGGFLGEDGRFDSTSIDNAPKRTTDESGELVVSLAEFYDKELAIKIQIMGLIDPKNPARLTLSGASREQKHNADAPKEKPRSLLDAVAIGMRRGMKNGTPS